MRCVGGKYLEHEISNAIKLQLPGSLDIHHAQAIREVGLVQESIRQLCSSNVKQLEATFLTVIEEETYEVVFRCTNDRNSAKIELIF